MLQTASLFTTLKNLYQKELAISDHVDNMEQRAYLQQHMNDNVINRQIEATSHYLDYIPQNATVLDWGCNHAPDSLIIREKFGDSVQLYGCDFMAEGYAANFHNRAGLKYTKLEDNVKLPYEDKMFDVVISDGTMEHAAFDHESLKEIYRVLKDGGLFIILHLPNYYSYTEYLTRKFVKRGYHYRKYKMDELESIMLHAGMVPVKSRYHQFIPSTKGQKFFSKIWFLNSPLEKIPPFKYFCSNLMMISRKVNAI